MHTTDQLNSSLAGRYTIERLIGEGGMATVYLARDVRHNRRVALKVLKPDLGAVVGVERFLSEIQVTANLQHPNLLPLFDSGAADSLLFYVMPYVEGESLRKRLMREKQLPIDEAVRIATSVASALDYAHRHGVIHRDLKPENILLHEGQPMVADFGIALAVSNAGGNRITQTGVSLGTPHYMSPEQATGDRLIDARTDIYSLGAVTYEMLTAEPPHTGNTSQAVIARVLTEKPRSIRSTRPSVPENIEAAVERALEKLPADRWATAREFSEALTGARVVTRSTYSTIGEHTTFGLTIGRRRIGGREIVAWTLALLAIGGAAATAFSARGQAAVGNPVLFEIRVPDSIVAINISGAGQLALSKDGSMLVFQGTRGRRSAPSLFLRRLQDLNAQEIRGSEEGRSPVISPDGSEVAYAVTAGIGSIKRLPIHGGSARTLVDSAAANNQVSWGEGGLIAFATSNGVYSTSADGGEVHLLARPDSARKHMRYAFPSLLPGGKAAVIAISKGTLDLTSATLGIIAIPSGKVTELGVRGTYPRYTPIGGGYIVYATAEAWIYAVPFSARSGKVTGAPFAVVEGVRVGTGGAAGLAVADNGTLAYMSGVVFGNQRELVVVNRAGTEQSLGMKLGVYTHPRVSPNGRQISMGVFTTTFGIYPNPDVWRLDLTSKVLDRLTTDSNSNLQTWIDNGSEIAYTRMRTDSVAMRRAQYAAARPDTMYRAKIRVYEVAAARNAKYVAFRVGTTTNNDIWVAHLDSLSAARPFLAEPYMEIAPAVSPDGRLLAYVTNRTGRAEVYVRRIVGGGDELQLSTDGGTEPAWGASSSELLYRGPSQMMSVRLATAGRLAVERTTGLFRDDFQRGTTSTNYDVFPDGQRFVMVRDRSVVTSGIPIVVLVNWLAAARSGSPR